MSLVVVVTGATGFLGRELVRRLEERGDRVLALSRPAFDLADPASMRLQGLHPDLAFHLAADTRRPGSPESARINVEGTRALLDALPEDTRVVHTGTTEERRAESPYAISKLEAGTAVAERGGTHVRLSLVYGPGQGPEFLVPQMLRALSTGKALDMTEGRQVRDFLWRDDAVEGLLRAAASPDLAGQAVDLCTGVGTALRDLVELLGRLAGRPVPVRLGALPYRPGEVFECAGSPARLEALTGWRPPTGLREGLSRLLEAER